MLHQAELTARRYSGHGSLWQHPYANPQPRAASALASVWFTAYPASFMTRPGDSVLHGLGDPELWSLFREMGITAVHTGPMKRAGGIRGREYTPTVDGNFDRISTEIDPGVRHRGRVQGDGPAGARQRRASSSATSFPATAARGPTSVSPSAAIATIPGLYHMVEIQPKTGRCCRLCRPARTRSTSSPRSSTQLKARGYIVGQLPRTIFYEKGVKETDWSATDAVVGATARAARWVYLHYFKEGQPTFNWLDPPSPRSGSSSGDALHSLGTLGERMLRLDANGFLGIEVGPERRPRLVRGPPAVGHVQPAHRRPGAQARRLHVPGAQPDARGHQGHVAGRRGSLLRLRHPPRLPPRARHRRCRVPAAHAGRCSRPTRSIRPASSTRCRITTSSPSSWCTSGRGTRTTRSPSAARA